MKRVITLTVNGERHEVAIESHQLLHNVLRAQLGLTGTKESCGVGTCGACTVILDGKLVSSCLKLAIEADGKELTTIEGLSKNGKLHPLQEAFVEMWAIQCGFCTPGMILTALKLLEENPQPTRQQVIEALEGNLCRCTGYVKIVDGVLLAAERMRMALTLA